MGNFTVLASIEGEIVMTDLSIFKQRMAPWFLGDLDSFFSFFEKNSGSSYPPHNVVKVDDNNIVLQMALAGISKEDLSLKVKGNCFTVSYSKTDSDQKEHQWRGISARNFSKTFKLREDWEVSKASLDNGLLEVVIAYSIPEDEQEVAIEVK